MQFNLGKIIRGIIYTVGLLGFLFADDMPTPDAFYAFGACIFALIVYSVHSLIQYWKTMKCKE